MSKVKIQYYINSVLNKTILNCAATGSTYIQQFYASLDMDCVSAQVVQIQNYNSYGTISNIGLITFHFQYEMKNWRNAKPEQFIQSSKCVSQQICNRFLDTCLSQQNITRIKTDFRRDSSYNKRMQVTIAIQGFDIQNANEKLTLLILQDIITP